MSNTITLSKKSMFIAVGGTLTALIVLFTAYVNAAIPSTDTGKIEACYRNSGFLVPSPGALRVIDSESGAVCNNNETPINWSQNGNGGVKNEAVGFISGDGQLDPELSDNVISANQTVDPDHEGYCLEIDVTNPKFGVGTNNTLQDIIISIRGVDAVSTLQVEAFCPAEADALVDVFDTSQPELGLGFIIYGSRQ